MVGVANKKASDTQSDRKKGGRTKNNTHLAWTGMVD
jgi:hypothetical protein